MKVSWINSTDDGKKWNTVSRLIYVFVRAFCTVLLGTIKYYENKFKQ